jgi:acetyltransferase-like isoleucine patch superfamily enzyme
MLRVLSLSFLKTHKTLLRLKAKVFSVLISGAFGEFGRRSVLVPPIRLYGETMIFIGDRVTIHTRSWLQVLTDCEDVIGLRIGNGTSIGSSSVISAANDITIGENVILASNVCIVDHMHKYKDINLPIGLQGIDKVAPVHIKRNTWIGQNVVILPGVTIGENSVIGANSVVNRNVPDYSVAVGSPAKVIKIIPKTKANAVE